MRFVDTNVLIYAVSRDAASRAKRAIARDLLQSVDLCLSVQVLQEFFVQATRPARTGSLTDEEAAAYIESWLRFPVQSMTPDLVLAALAQRKRSRISYWDASIIEAARALDCDTVVSEDLQDGQNFAGVRVVNPFRAL